MISVLKAIVALIAGILAFLSVFVAIFLIGWSIYKRDYRWAILAVVIYLLGIGCNILFERLAAGGIHDILNIGQKHD